MELALFLYAYHHSHRYVRQHHLMEWELDLTWTCCGDGCHVRSIRDSPLGDVQNRTVYFQARPRICRAPMHPVPPAVCRDLLGIALPSFLARRTDDRGSLPMSALNLPRLIPLIQLDPSPFAQPHVVAHLDSSGIVRIDLGLIAPTHRRVRI